nr:immunoglobulin heavy chain junction region [Mus musculus]
RTLRSISVQEKRDGYY